MAFFACALAWTLDCAAQETAPEEEHARRTIEQAVEEYEAGNYPEAHALFRRAHALSPSARTLRGIGMASFEMRRYVNAVRSLSASLEETRRPLTDVQRQHVTELLERARSFVVTVRVELDPREASLSVDGADTVREPDGSILLDPGSHTIAASMEGRRTRSLNVDLESGSEQTVRLSLEPIVTRTRIVEVRRESVSRRTALADGLLTAGIVALAVGAIAGGISIATGLIALDDEAELEARCMYMVCPGELAETQLRARSLAQATDALWISGSILAAAGIASLVVQAVLPEEQVVRASALCTPEGCAASVGGRL